MNLNFSVDNLKDFNDVRDVLQKFKEALQSSVLEKGTWKFVEITIESPVTSLQYSHRLNFTPKDVIDLSVKGTATVTWHFDDFDDTNIYLSSTGACTVRAFIGRHREGQ